MDVAMVTKQCISRSGLGSSWVAKAAATAKINQEHDKSEISPYSSAIRSSTRYISIYFHQNRAQIQPPRYSILTIL